MENDNEVDYNRTRGMKIIVENVNNFGESIEMDPSSIDFSNVEVDMGDMDDPTIVNTSK